MITSSGNKHVKLVRALQRRRGVRHAERSFVVEGTRLLEETLRAGQEPRLLFYTPHWQEHNPQLLQQLQALGGQSELVTPDILALCSDVETPQGILAVVSMSDDEDWSSPDLILVLDRIADPGNAGTILRSALAADVGAVYLTEGSVDAFNPKVVRGGMGAHFHLRIRELSNADIKTALGSTPLWTAEARHGSPYTLIDWCKPSAIAIGSEAHGFHPTLRASAVGQIHIPIAQRAESLNAATAAAVILFEIQRQRGN